MLSASCKYGIRAAVHLARHGHVERNYASIRAVAEALGISFYFLTKILQGLTQSGLLISSRGPQGGVALARDPAGITLLEVLRSIDGDALFRECVLGLPMCDGENPCPLHAQLASRRADLESLFAGTTLGQLSGGKSPAPLSSAPAAK